jgi:hypothetical protein
MDRPTPPDFLQPRNNKPVNKPPINMGTAFMPNTETIVSTRGPNMTTPVRVAMTGIKSMPSKFIFP